MPCKVIAYGDPILRRQSEEIENIDEEIHDLVDDMSITVNVYHGVGLAAPQVGVSKMLFLINWDRIDAEKSGIKAYINPRILEKGEDTVIDDEGCLSLPDVWASVKRPDFIRVEFTTIDGQKLAESFSGMPSRVFQHEYDHLQGILFIDRISISERNKVKDTLQAIMDGEIPIPDMANDAVSSEDLQSRHVSSEA